MLLGSPWFVDNIKEYRVNKPITRLLSPEDHSNELLYALQEAQYILTSLFTRNESIRSPVAKGLKRYVKAIVLQLEATSFHHTIKAAKLLCSIALESLYPMRYCHSIRLTQGFSLSLVSLDTGYILLTSQCGFIATMLTPPQQQSTNLII